MADDVLAHFFSFAEAVRRPVIVVPFRSPKHRELVAVSLRLAVVVDVFTAGECSECSEY
jgi:hypothetical protein